MDLVAFYRQHDPKPDHRGRKLDTILSWTDTKLESSHDYIQVIFPLPEPSMVIADAPIIDERVYEAFNSGNKQMGLHRNLQRALSRMLEFYGFRIPDEEHIKPIAGQASIPFAAEWAPNHKTRFSNWVSLNHNHQRITRIIRSLRILGRQDLAKIFLEAVDSVYKSPEYQKRRHASSMEWWVRAFNWPLYSLPQGIEGEVWPGLGWLKKKIDAQEEQQVEKLDS